MLTISQVNGAILGGGFTIDQLASVVDAVKFARSQIAKDTKRQLRVGVKVSFRNSRTGMTMSGSVKSVAIKFASIDCGASGSWKVPVSMLVVA